MAESRMLAGFRAPLLFLKATKVLHSNFTRHDGAVVRGHYPMMRVAHDASGVEIFNAEPRIRRRGRRQAETAHSVWS